MHQEAPDEGGEHRRCEAGADQCGLHRPLSRVPRGVSTQIGHFGLIVRSPSAPPANGTLVPKRKVFGPTGRDKAHRRFRAY
ncbi:hypothetical protein FEF34_16200 [Streptomyces marianii]|uniref:Uncharacterized protein n=1 Tax=Streptomyces marianii TaxID=1817406 RepID=A0A5R9EL19_9ACTN|nr:hypothetical protein FEF34_16200 [Streptomyces marianii]